MSYKINSLTQGKIGKNLFRMTLGMLVGHISMTIFNITDTYFVSKLGTQELAAMGFTFPFVALVNHFIFGIGIGSGALIARSIGQNNEKKVKQYTTHCLYLVFTVGLTISFFGIIFARDIFTFFNAKGETLELVLSYMYIWLIGCPIGSIPMVVNNAIRATGNTKTPGIIMALSSGINIILDPLLIFGIWIFPEMGIKGAAVATVTARTLSSILAISYLHIKMKLFDFSFPGLTVIFESWKKIMNLAVPSSLSLMMIPISAAIITKILADYGDQAVAAAGAGSRIDMVTLMALFALASVLMPFTAQNFGANHFKRITTALKIAEKFAFIWGIFMFVSIFFFRQEIAMIFSKDGAVIDFITFYLLAITVSYPSIGICIMCSNVLNGLHKTFLAAVLNLLRTIVFMIPAVILGSIAGGVEGIFIAMAFINIIFSFVYHRVAAKTIKKKIVECNIHIKGSCENGTVFN
jgi:putative MATE family efflux protein